MSSSSSDSDSSDWSTSSSDMDTSSDEYSSSGESSQEEQQAGGGGGGNVKPKPPKKTPQSSTAVPAGGLSTTGNLPPLQGNPSLQFKFPDNQTVNIDGRVHTCISLVMNAPWREHRCIDLFRAAIRMFIVTLRTDFNGCLAKANASKKPIRFTWQNRGPIAEHFAILCDASKILYEHFKVRVPQFTVFLDWIIQYLLDISQVPRDVVTEKTYAVKRKDWEKGGTRYNAESSENTSNVLFAQVSVRREKLEEYLKSERVSAGATSVIVPSDGSAKVAPKAPLPTKQFKTKSKTAVMPASAVTATKSNAGPSPLQQQKSDVPVPGGGMAALPSGGPAARSGPGTALRSAEQRAKDQLKYRAQLLVGSSSIKYPLSAKPVMPQFVQICSEAKNFFQIQTWLLSLVIRSVNRSIRQQFDVDGGMVVMQQWTERRMEDIATVQKHLEDTLKALHTAKKAAGDGELPKQAKELFATKIKQLQFSVAERSAGFIVFLRMVKELVANVQLAQPSLTAWLQAPRAGEIASTSAALVDPTDKSQHSLDWLRRAPVENREQLETCIRSLGQSIRYASSNRKRGENGSDLGDDDNGDGLSWKRSRHAEHKEDRLRSATLVLNEERRLNELKALRSLTQEDDYLPILKSAALPVLVNGGPTQLSFDAEDATAAPPMMMLGFSELGGLRRLSEAEATAQQEADDAQPQPPPRLACGLMYDPTTLIGY